MWNKPRERIRRDALQIARKKQDEGCQTCADGYARVAERYGATRRDFIKVGLGGVAAMVAVGAALGPIEAAAYAPCEYCSYVTVDAWCEGCTYVFIWECIDYAWGLMCEDGIVEDQCSSLCCP